MSATLQTTTLAGGCFWCIEAAFNQLQGVKSATSGYMGGSSDTANYQAISRGETDHAEVVQITFDHTLISFREILEIFFALHDPTQLNRQGNDVGRQYRSAIFYHNQAQADVAKAIIEEIEQDAIWSDPVVTELTPASEFYSGEAFHQEYFDRNPESRYCQAVISPKLAKFKQTFANKIKSAVEA